MSKVENELRKLKLECDAQKEAFSRSAYSLDIYETEKTVTIQLTHVEISNCRVLPTISIDTRSYAEVTFQTYSGANTMATIEPRGRRIPYSGGAKWIIADAARGESFTITVRSTVPGEIQVEIL